MADCPVFLIAINLHETHTPFHQPPRQQTFAAKRFRFLPVDTI